MLNGNAVKEILLRPCQTTAPRQAFQMPEAFFVDSMEGQVSGKAGDYLMVGSKGERYICDKQIFEDTYQWLDLT